MIILAADVLTAGLPALKVDRPRMRTDHLSARPEFERSLGKLIHDLDQPMRSETWLIIMK